MDSRIRDILTQETEEPVQAPPQDDRKARIIQALRGLLKGFISPAAPSTYADENMEDRRKSLESQNNTGGMFDVIHRGKKVREDALKDFDY